MRADYSRDAGVDITRLVAFFSVPGVHFFLNSGFYKQTIDGMPYYLMMLCRTFFSICVPLFIIITGFLMSTKKISIEKKGLGNYYKKISRVLVTYVISILIIIVFQNYMGEKIGFKEGLLSILRYDYYSWYIEMYIGLFLLTPFLNLLWEGINKKEGKQALLFVLLIMTAAPGIFNIWHLDSGIKEAFLHPWMYDNTNQIIPSWWKGIYPITYYYLGAYLRSELDIKKVNTATALALFIISVVAFGSFNYYRSYSINYVWGEWNSWQGIQNVVNSVLAFIAINSVDYKIITTKVSKMLAIVAELTLGAYLLSWIPDHYYYPRMVSSISSMNDRFLQLPVIVGKSIIVSIALSGIVYLLVKMIFSIPKLRFKNE